MDFEELVLRFTQLPLDPERLGRGQTFHIDSWVRQELRRLRAEISNCDDYLLRGLKFINSQGRTRGLDWAREWCLAYAAIFDEVAPEPIDDLQELAYQLTLIGDPVHRGAQWLSHLGVEDTRQADTIIDALRNYKSTDDAVTNDSPCVRISRLLESLKAENGERWASAWGIYFYGLFDDQIGELIPE